MGLAALVSGCTLDSEGGRSGTATFTPTGVPPTLRPAPVAPSPTSGPTTTTTGPTTTTAPTLPSVPPPRPGPPQVISGGPTGRNQIALTIDDGFCATCAAAYVAFAAQSGIHITFSPNGTYGSIWSPLASQLRPLIAAGQVQIGNHTFSHANLLTLTDANILSEIEQNDAWIQATFGITSRPWFRPPYGYRNSHTDGVAASIGYTNILMWDGTFGDATLITPTELMANATKWLQAGTIMLGHANYPTVSGLFGQIQAIIQQRALQPVTLDEMFGTSRATG